MATSQTAAPAAASASDNASNTGLDTVHRLLGAKLVVTMTDGRVARGNFVSLDRLGNILLEDVVESRQVSYIPPNNGSGTDTISISGGGDGGGEEATTTTPEVQTWDTKRTLSQAVIPGDRMAKVEISKGEW
eukprot:CAMPEP_0183721178 /NCGR_PEP_ID=MMETSP0737-20130205/13545_1 /TAXON_ID=385413 /ORGANISM="Thalassiosira miniscula, Strain CCMP1093" /LENGTH=131 /DNA_ID=CAMNT_0025951149 /DNA_START=46 /DNA_END=438 /DNA_ORIENTATION=+